MYDLNGGKWSEETEETTSFDTVPEIACPFKIKGTEPAREGYTFSGWSETKYEDKDTDKVVMYKAEPTKDEILVGIKSEIILEWEEGKGSTENPVTKTLYAVWEKNGDPPPTTYTVMYTDGVTGETVFPDQGFEEQEEGDDTPPFQKVPNSDCTETLEDGTVVPKREGWTFEGWELTTNPNKTGVQEKINSEDANDDNTIIYTAIWKEEKAPAENTDTYECTAQPDARSSTASSCPPSRITRQGITSPWTPLSPRIRRSLSTAQNTSFPAGIPRILLCLRTM